MAYLNTTLSSGASIGAQFAALRQTVVTRIMRGHHYRQTFKSLSALSNSQLADLGLSRGELHHVALESARKAAS